jgi:glucose-6-phosphate dehydrogenase assembly protein OpcA
MAEAVERSRALDPRWIEAEIARIRERESGPWSAGTKTTLFNLVIARGPGDGVDASLDYLLGKRPSRILTISRGDGPTTEVVVSGRCHPDPRGRGVCCEEVAIAAGADGLGDDPGAWGPILVPDIPTYFWWATPGLPIPRLVREAAGQTDKLIVDTARAADPLAVVQGLAALREQSRRAFAVTDLAWGRTRPLRVQAARAFDPVEARPFLERISAVRLRGGSPAEALAFFLWLAARLGWRAGARAAAAFPAFVDAAGNEVDLDHSRPGALAAGVSLSFLVRDGEATREIAIECAGDGCVHLGSEHGAWRVASDGDLLLRELDSLGQDELLEEAMNVARAARGQ